MSSTQNLLADIRALIERATSTEPRTSIHGLRVSRFESADPDHELTEPMFVLMAQGGKRLYLDQEVVEYRTGDCLAVTISTPLSGHFIEASPSRPALAVGLPLDSSEISALIPRLPSASGSPPPPGPEQAIGTWTADAPLLDAVARLLRLQDHPGDAAVIAPLTKTEILWRLLTGPMGSVVAQIGLIDSSLAHVNRAIARIRANLDEPITITDLAGDAGMSVSTFQRHFRAVTGETPLQFQKELRLHEARSLLLTQTQDVTSVAHAVGYKSATQFVASTGRCSERLHDKTPCDSDLLSDDR